VPRGVGGHQRIGIQIDRGEGALLGNRPAEHPILHEVEEIDDPGVVVAYLVRDVGLVRIEEDLAQARLDERYVVRVEITIAIGVGARATRVGGWVCDATLDEQSIRIFHVAVSVHVGVTRLLPRRSTWPRADQDERRDESQRQERGVGAHVHESLP
jgi:hypothetical protein